MPTINFEYDDQKVSEEEVRALSDAAIRIFKTRTGINSAFVFANSARIKVDVAPIELFVRITDYKIPDLDKLFAEVKSDLVEWKKMNSFSHPINLTIIPIHWKFETNI